MIGLFNLKRLGKDGGVDIDSVVYQQLAGLLVFGSVGRSNARSLGLLLERGKRGLVKVLLVVDGLLHFGGSGDAGLVGSGNVLCNAGLSLAVCAVVLVKGSLRAIDLDDGRRIKIPAVAKDAVVSPVCRNAAHRGDGDVVDQADDHDKDRQGQDAVGDDGVDALGDGLPALLAVVDLLDKRGDVLVTLIGDDALCVVVKRGFGLGDDVAYLRRDAKVCRCLLVALKRLDGKVALL